MQIKPSACVNEYHLLKMENSKSIFFLPFFNCLKMYLRTVAAVIFTDVKLISDISAQCEVGVKNCSCKIERKIKDDVVLSKDGRLTAFNPVSLLMSLLT